MDVLRQRLAEATDPASKARIARIIAQQEHNARNREERARASTQGGKGKQTDDQRASQNIFADLEREIREDEARREREAEQLEAQRREAAAARRRAEAEKRAEEQRRKRERRQQREKWQREEQPKWKQQQKKNTPVPPFAAIPSAAITDWRQHVSLAFTSYAAMQAFPDPPAAPCGRTACHATRWSRALEACQCNIRACVQAAGLVTKTQLKIERLKWHPDRFAGCAEEKRTAFAKMGKEVFVAVDGMYQGVTGGRCAGFDERK
ncbi:hypothetical protein BST61_g3003 [Cercospora zeina]